MFNGIKATILQRNSNDQFFCDPCGNYGKEQIIPCGNGIQIGEPHWAVPVKQDAYVKGFSYEPNISGGTDKPTYDSMPVFKLTNTNTNDNYWVLGEIVDYFEQCATCCDAAAIPVLNIDKFLINPVQDVCVVNGVGNAYFSIPELIDGQVYGLNGSINGLQFEPMPAIGELETPEEIVDFLNDNWGERWTLIENSGEYMIRYETSENVSIGLTICALTSQSEIPPAPTNGISDTENNTFTFTLAIMN